MIYHTVAKYQRMEPISILQQDNILVPIPCVITWNSLQEPFTYTHIERVLQLKIFHTLFNSF